MDSGCGGGKKVAIKSIGCRTNQEEMVTLRLQLENEGYEITDDVSSAEYIVVNTCAVTAGTESKTRRLLSAVSTEAPDAQILVTGCLAQQKPDQLKEIPNIKWVVGNTFKNSIVSIIQSHEGVFHADFTTVNTDELQLDTLDVLSPTADNSRTRFPVKIQEGCNFWCSYCIVPSLRGPSRSAAQSSVVALCRKAIAAGYKELVLTGTHIGQYGTEENSSLIHLLKMLCELDGSFRIRLSSLDPRDLSDELLCMIIDNNRICDHLHISLQSLSNDVLGKMKRPYDDLEQIIGKLQEFRRRMPYAGIGADLIVGHPGESKENFLETLDNVKKIGFSYAHIFRYSVRPGTAAAAFPDQVTESEKTRRSEILRNAIDESRNVFLKKMDGITQTIIVESENPVRGLTSNYLHVEIPDARASRNDWLDVSVKSVSQGRYCLAELLQ